MACLCFTDAELLPCTICAASLMQICGREGKSVTTVSTGRVFWFLIHSCFPAHSAAIAEKQRTGEDPEWGSLPLEGEVDLLHASPPCQELSMLNQHTDALKAERVLYPLLDQVGPGSGTCCGSV